MNRKHLTSSTKPGDSMTAPLRVVLHESHSHTPERPEWVVHFENMNNGGKFSGQYFRDDENPTKAYCDALAFFAFRCWDLRVDPMPDQPDALQSFMRDAIANTEALNREDKL